MRPAIPLAGALILVFATAASLALPWIAIGGAPGRSSIDLIGSINALDIVGGLTLALILGAWLLVPVGAAGALLLGAAGRPRTAAVVVLVVSLLVGVGALAIVATGGVGLAWGGVLGAVTAGAAIVSAALALLGHRAGPGPVSTGRRAR